MKRSLRGVCALTCLLASAGALAGEDILVADFESDGYGDWKVTGKAFGPGPAKGTLRGQMPVSGYKGKRLVNTFFEGDGTVGTLTSPPLKIERKYIVFLIGGGMHPGKACIELLVGGEVVRTATGPNDRPGGSERLAPAFWDVSELAGKKARIRIVDKATGGWGHVNIDHIVQTDTKPKVPKRGNFSRRMTVSKRYLVIPIHKGARKCTLELEVAGKPVRRYGTEVAPDADTADFWAFFTIEAYEGKEAVVRAGNCPEAGFALIRQADEVPGEQSFYTEELRPQLRFSQKVGWNNDTNGMVYYDDEWHLYFQHNPVGWKWGNMTWGHAVSTDLVHWKQLPNALFPQTMARGACFSGSAVVDADNTAGFQGGREKVIVAALTDTGAGEAIAYSEDRGRSFTWYEGNPVVEHKGRDPKVIWYEPGKHWVMAVYNISKEHGKNIAFHTSKDLKEWTEQSHIEGFHECPEIFELPVDGDAANTRWVLFDASARYLVGRFDGKRFAPEHEGRHRVHYGPYYASQTFSNPPDGRRIQMGWARIPMPGMPFNQAFSFPHRLTLRTTPEGIRMFAEPIKELATLRRKTHTAGAADLAAGSPETVGVAGELLEIRAEFAVGQARAVGLDIGGNRVVYDIPGGKLHGADLKPVDGKVSMHVILDRPMMEIAGNGGRVYITARRGKRGEVRAVKAFAEGGPARLLALEAHELESIWAK